MAYPRRPVPYGFEEYVKSGYHSINHLRNRYHCNVRTLYRWLEETNIESTSKKKRYGAYTVIMCDLMTGKEIDSFPTVAAAARAVNGYDTSINYAARGINKTAEGFKWRFADEKLICS